MEPKFQSSFIPKGPVSSGVAGQPLAPRRKERSLLGFIAALIFSLSVIAAVGAFGYKWYLNYSITNMKSELEAGKAALDPETVAEITRLNDRIVAAEQLISRHTILTPLFRFLEASTLRSVRLTDFEFENGLEGLKLMLKGEARGYADLALQAEAFNKSEYLKNPVFSDLQLDEKGNVTFSLEANIDQAFLSYRKEVERIGTPARATSTPVTSQSAATSTATGTPARTGTSTSTTTPR